MLRWVELALRTELAFRACGAARRLWPLRRSRLRHAGARQRIRRRPVRHVFGGGQKQQARQPSPQASFFADPFGTNPQQAQPAPAPRVAGSGPAFCVRSCDGKYFPLTMRGNATPVQMCQAFCPASATKVFYGGHIDSASASNGERYADSENAFAYRKALRADCTCNGRSPSGLAPVDLALDTSLRSGDVVATTDGLVAYTGVRLGAGQSRGIHAGCCPIPASPSTSAPGSAK